MTLPARFRNPDRDLQADIDRLGPLYGQLCATLAGIARESEGLSRRLDEVRTRTAALMGNEDGIYFEREPTDEARLVEAEAQMMEAYGRLEQLRMQKAMIAALRDEIEGSGIGRALRAGADRPGSLRRLRRAVLEHLGAIRRFSRVFGWALMLVIVYATLSGLEQRPMGVWLLPDIGRSFAFLAAAAAFAIGYPRQRLLIFAAGLAAVASLEIAQGWVPLRHGAVHDALVKAAGLSLGLLLVIGAERFKRSARLS